jgi:hypothetical protein
MTLVNSEAYVAVNKPTGDNPRKGAVKKAYATQEPADQHLNQAQKKGGQFMAVKKSEKVQGRP